MTPFSLGLELGRRTGLDRSGCSLSTLTSNEGWRDRQVRYFFWKYLLSVSSRLTSLLPFRNECWPLAAGNGPDDDKRLLPRRDRVGQWGVRRLMGQVLLAGEEAQERTALLRNVVADGAAQHG